MVNKDGKVVAPEMKSFQAAAASADWNSQPGYGVIITDQPGADTWPITTATWILMHKQPRRRRSSAEALKFFAWAYAKGAKDGRGARLHPDAGQRRAERREDLGERNQGRQRQAAVRRPH